MRKIKQGILFYRMLSKRFFKKYSFLLLLCAVPVLAFCLKNVSEQESGMLHIVLCLEDKSDETAERVAEKLAEIGCTMEERVSRQINMSWGVTPLVIPEEKDTFELFAHSVEEAKKRGYLDSGDTVVITSGVPIGTSGTTNMIKVDTVD